MKAVIYGVADCARFRLIGGHCKIYLSRRRKVVNVFVSLSSSSSSSSRYSINSSVGVGDGRTPQRSAASSVVAREIRYRQRRSVSHPMVVDTAHRMGRSTEGRHGADIAEAATTNTNNSNNKDIYPFSPCVSISFDQEKKISTATTAAAAVYQAI